MDLEQVMNFICFAWSLYQMYKEFSQAKKPVDEGKKRRKRKPKSKGHK